MTALTLAEHAPYCTPRPGEDGPRMETYGAPVYSADGKTQIGSTRVVRCVECANASYDGVLKERN
jgi:hypothetical protein